MSQVLHAICAGINMSTYIEAVRSKTSLKTFLSFYSWYHSSEIVFENGQYMIMISVNRINDEIRNVIPNTHNNITIRTNNLGLRI